MTIPRRTLLLALPAASLARPPQSPPPPALTFPGKRAMIVHSDFPEDLESLPEYFDSWITPNDAFFVRQHLPRPQTSAATHTIAVGGLVNRGAGVAPITIAALRALPQVTVPAVLECAGNGRSYFRPKMPGLQWSKGAIGNAEWRGPRLSDVLTTAAGGAAPQAAYADFNGLDAGVAKTPDFIRSIPMRKVMHPSTILALDMNGAPLPDLHGGPVRLVVPGWDGASWVKWVSRIDVTDKMHAGFYMNPAYRYPRNPVPPGGAAKPDELDVLEGMAVKSFFARPADQAKTKVGVSVTLTGPAWAGENRVTRVEISPDGGSTWRPAALSKQDFAFSWRIWTAEWKPARPGYYTLCCRATDSAGRVQPIEPAWNPSGYLWNAIDRVGVIVEG